MAGTGATTASPGGAGRSRFCSAAHEAGVKVCMAVAVRNLPVPVGGLIIKDQIVMLKGAKWQKLAKFKGWTLRRVEAIVEVDARDKVMGFI